ncbi:MAG: hypothetical protein MHPSP_002548 [Paramarteilia canceri]
MRENSKYAASIGLLLLLVSSLVSSDLVNDVPMPGSECSCDFSETDEGYSKWGDYSYFPKQTNENERTATAVICRNQKNKYWPECAWYIGDTTDMTINEESDLYRYFTEYCRAGRSYNITEMKGYCYFNHGCRACDEDDTANECHLVNAVECKKIDCKDEAHVNMSLNINEIESDVDLKQYIGENYLKQLKECGLIE